MWDAVLDAELIWRGGLEGWGSALSALRDRHLGHLYRLDILLGYFLSRMGKMVCTNLSRIRGKPLEVS
jgi:hypothetical protein